MAGPLHRRAVLIVATCVVVGLGVVTGVLWSASHSSATPGTPAPGPALDADGIPTGWITYDEIKSLPDAHIVYPGARLWREFGHGMLPSGPEHAAPTGADYGGIYLIPASASNLFSWYDDQLRQRGYRQHAVGSAPQYLKSWGWERGRTNRELFALNIDDPKDLGETLGTPVPTGQTVFEIALLIVPTGGETPPPTP